MDSNERRLLINKVREGIWVDKVNEARLQDNAFCKWVSTFHPDQLICKLDGGFLNGSYNVSQKVIFDDDCQWIVRFPRVGAICDDYADEKVQMEVEVINIIREHTAIPVPKIHAWGVAADDPLHLGPFIIMDYIHGERLMSIFAPPDTRLMREDVRDDIIEHIYKQMANFLLQLFSLNFDRIGSLPPLKTGGSVPVRPLTWKVHDILQDGGVNTFGDRNQGFSTTAEYFQYVIGQDLLQLSHQPTSVSGPRTARARFKAFNSLASMIPRYINGEYSNGPFKLICDDLGLANMIVRSDKDLTIVGVMDLEWSYIGPAQLLGSAPWWLLQDRPTNWDYDGNGEPPKMAAWYLKNFEIFKRVLREEEELMGNKDKKLSKLVEWSETSGAMWFHMLLLSGFNDHHTFPFTELRKSAGTDWEKRELELDEEEIKIFVERKLRELDQYDEDLAKTEADKTLMESGKMTKEEFIATL